MVSYTIFSALVLIIMQSFALSPEEQNQLLLKVDPRVEKLTQLATNNPIIRMNETMVDDFIKGMDLKYKIVVLFTVLNPDRICSSCNPAFNEFATLVDSFGQDWQSFSQRLFFAVVDFDECSKVFRSFNIYSAPVLVHFSTDRTHGSNLNKFDVNSDVKAEDMAEWIKIRTGIQIKISRPVENPDIQDFLRYFGSAITASSIVFIFYSVIKTFWSKTIIVIPLPIESSNMEKSKLYRKTTSSSLKWKVQTSKKYTTEDLIRMRKRKTCSF